MILKNNKDIFTNGACIPGHFLAKIYVTNWKYVLIETFLKLSVFI